MDVFYTDGFVIPLPPGHRFPAAKYGMLRRRLEGDGALSSQCQLRVPDPISAMAVERVHERDYRERVFSGQLDPREQRRIGLPWSPELLERTKRSVGGTLAACETALESGHACYLGGGTHHAFPDFGAGFCIFNDAPIAIRELQARGRIRRAVILDCDVHQGDGTAAILEHDPSVFTMSMHGARNFPFRKQRSDLDIPLDDGTTDDPYLEKLSEALTLALERGRPDLAIYIAGADPFEGDRLGKLSLTKPGLAQRDRLVVDRLHRSGIPFATVMGGGYAPNLEDTVDIQLETIRVMIDSAA